MRFPNFFAAVVLCCLSTILFKLYAPPIPGTDWLVGATGLFAGLMAIWYLLLDLRGGPEGPETFWPHSPYHRKSRPDHMHFPPELAEEWRRDYAKIVRTDPSEPPPTDTNPAKTKDRDWFTRPDIE